MITGGNSPWNPGHSTGFKEGGDMHVWKVVLILVAFMLVGCSGPVAFTRLTDTAYPPGLKDDIEVFVSKQPSRKFVRIAIISTDQRKKNFAENIDLMKRQAAELGADGIILISAQKRSLGIILFPDTEISSQAHGFSGDAGYSYSAYAIKFLGQE